ncbi:Cof-type HAD-IIB family hydrolase [Numidum massiliense]|uniref:Cof-type HAD-IIB family hydrolase n=1 Tax=Numidum massiliense TaxID=1522315 RepID=UPI0006D58A22|nr:Cof-type HAD-IIB family hydrolase [Numidum massiliense]
MTYELIALDLDGTLLTDEKEITRETKQLLQRLRQEGKYIVICTGRSTQSVRKLLQNTTFASHVITNNGGTVIDASSAETLYTATIPRRYLGIFRDICDEYSVHCDLTTEKNMYVEQMAPEMIALYERYHVAPFEIGDFRDIPEEVTKCTLFSEKEKTIEQLIPRLTEQYGSDLTIVQSGEHFIDIMKRGTSKGEALRWLVPQLNLQAADVLAIGNYYNDAEMLAYAGLGVAVANAPEELRAAADAVTASNNADGVRLALEKYVCRKHV